MTIKWFKSPYNCVIFLLTQPQVANQQKKKKIKTQTFFSNFEYVVKFLDKPKQSSKFWSSIRLRFEFSVVLYLRYCLKMDQKCTNRQENNLRYSKVNCPVIERYPKSEQFVNNVTHVPFKYWISPVHIPISLFNTFCTNGVLRRELGYIQPSV